MGVGQVWPAEWRRFADPVSGAASQVHLVDVPPFESLPHLEVAE
jgi:hypothetical protein